MICGVIGKDQEFGGGIFVDFLVGLVLVYEVFVIGIVRLLFY